MTRTIGVLSDRLLGLVVPRITAKADPCHNPYYVNCACINYVRRRAFCCSNGGCGSCQPYGYC